MCVTDRERERERDGRNKKSEADRQTDNARHRDMPLLVRDFNVYLVNI